MLKEEILSIEGLYTDSSINFQREWDHKHVRDRTKEAIEKSLTVEELG